MTHETPTIDTSLVDLSKHEWRDAVAAVARQNGYFQALGDRHFAAFVEPGDDSSAEAGTESGSTLLVSFETVQGIQVLSDLAQPLGWEMVRAHGWSHLCLASDGDTWFRDDAVYAFFDRLIDDGFFDEFDQVVFYGAGPCGYAAAAFSVVAPQAKVVVIQPQATLDPRITEWDDRFVDMRAQDFSTRYGYAPDMLDGAERAFVLYDPREKLDAMHAALFTRPNVTKLRLRLMGNAIQTDLLEMELLDTLLHDAADGTLDESSFAVMYRARRNYPPYLRNIMAALDVDGRTRLLRMLCTNVTARMPAPRFSRKLAELDGEKKVGHGRMSQDG